jgi:hypothetical protein
MSRAGIKRLTSERPAESGGVASAVALLIAYVSGVNDAGVIVSIGVVIGFVPAAITWAVETYRRAKCPTCPIAHPDRLDP